MIVTVTLNAAIDLTYVVERHVVDTPHRVEVVRARAGGKGINVARTLRELGEDVVAMGLAGGPVGSQILTELTSSGIESAFVPVEKESRRTVTVVSRSDGTTASYWEPGAPVSAAEWAHFVSAFRHRARGARVVVCSGSLPPGVPPDAYAQLGATAKSFGALTVVDAEGEPLRLAAASGADLLKPNAAELQRTTGFAAPIDGAGALLRAGASAVVVSLGALGLLAVTPTSAWRSVAPEQVAGNPTGAGDACVASLSVGLAADQSWPEMLRDAAALSAAAVLHPVAGGYDHAAYQEFLKVTETEQLHASDVNP